MKTLIIENKDSNDFEIVTKYGHYRIQEKEDGELDIIKITPFGDGLSIKPIVSNRIIIK